LHNGPTERPAPRQDEGRPVLLLHSRAGRIACAIARNARRGNARRRGCLIREAAVRATQATRRMRPLPDRRSRAIALVGPPALPRKEEPMFAATSLCSAQPARRTSTAANTRLSRQNHRSPSARAPTHTQEGPCPVALLLCPIKRKHCEASAEPIPRGGHSSRALKRRSLRSDRSRAALTGRVDKEVQ
jgi:hypothetical protein